MLTALFRIVIVLSVTGSIISVPLLLLKSHLLKRYGGKWYYYLWLLTLIMFVVPIGYVFRFLPVKTTAAVYGLAHAEALPYNPSAETLTHTIMGVVNSIAFNQAFGLVWLCGIVISAAYHVVVSRWLIWKIIRRGVSVSDAETAKALHDGLIRLNITSDIQMRVSSEICTPAIIGLYRPVIVLPDAMLRTPGIDLELIIFHELTHYKNKDVLYKYFMLLVKAVHWFNPFIYVIAKTVNECCEYACDFSVLQNMDEKFALRYANMIVEAIKVSISDAGSAGYMTVGLFRNKSNIKRRIELIMMNNKKTRIGATLIAVAAICVVSAYTALASGSAKSYNIVVETTDAQNVRLEQITPDYEKTPQKVFVFTEEGTVTDISGNEAILDGAIYEDTDGRVISLTITRAGNVSEGTELSYVVKESIAEDGTVYFLQETPETDLKADDGDQITISNIKFMPVQE